MQYPNAGMAGAGQAYQQNLAVSAEYQRAQAQRAPHYAAQIGSNVDLNNAILENRQRAAQLSQ